MKNQFVYVVTFLLFFVSTDGFTDNFQEGLLQAGIPEADTNILISHGYTDNTSLESLNLPTLMKMGVSGKSAAMILQFVRNIPLKSPNKLDDSKLPVRWRTVEKSVQSIHSMTKDIYEKTSEFQARRQSEIDKLIEQLNTATQQGDVDYQIATATIKNYDADTERLEFDIEWFDSIKSLVKGEELELTESFTKMPPQEARNFPVGKSFPLFASVIWNDDGLYSEEIWLDRADLRELQAKEEQKKQQKLEEESELAQLEQQRQEMEQATNEEQSRLKELLQQEEAELAQLTQRRLEEEARLEQLKQQKLKAVIIRGQMLSQEQVQMNEPHVQFAQLMTEDQQRSVSIPTLCSYIARISEQDKYNSQGKLILNSNEVSLTTVAAIIQQDRANFHKFHKRDIEDESDCIFKDKQKRASIGKSLSKGTIATESIREIIFDTPLIRVDIYHNHIDIYTID